MGKFMEGLVLGNGSESWAFASDRLSNAQKPKFSNVRLMTKRGR